MAETLEERVMELELRFMQHEQTIQDLNETICRQEQLIDRLQRSLTLIGEQVRLVAPSSIIDPDEEERPPHY